VVGNDRWPLPIPLAKGEGGWRYDVAAGRKEILARVIGANELGTIGLLRDLVDSQEAYEKADHDGDGLREYAQKFISTKGQKDGLWWDDEKEESPLGLEVGDFLDDVAKNPDPEQAVWGYRWKMLKGQGAKAPGGAFSYVINGNQVAGYAFVATPAAYKRTGVMTFLVSKSGKIYEKDLASRAPTSSRPWRPTSPTTPGRCRRTTSSGRTEAQAPRASPLPTRCDASQSPRVGASRRVRKWDRSSGIEVPDPG